MVKPVDFFIHVTKTGGTTIRSISGSRKQTNRKPADPARIALCEFALDLFEKRIAAQPPEFADQLAALRHGNNAAQRSRTARAGWGSIRRTLGFTK